MVWWYHTVMSARARHLPLVLSIGLAATACADPSVNIRFDIPAPYDAVTESVVLRVLVPPGDASLAFDCDDVAFHDVTDETLRLSQVQEVVAGREGLDLSGIPRIGAKLLWLEARDAQNQPVAAGCAQVAEITGDEQVTVTGEPMKIAAFRGFIDGGFVSIGQSLPDMVELTVTDTTGLPLDMVTVKWRVIGLAGAEMTSGESVTSNRGSAIIALDRPEDIPGPSVLDVGVRWERTPLPLLGGFGKLDVLFENNLPGDSGSDLGSLSTRNLYATGQFGPAGEMGLVALGPTRDPVGEGRTVLVAYHDPAAGSPPFRVLTSSQTIRGQNIAISTIHRSNRDIAMVASPSALVELQVQASGVNLINHPAPGPLPLAMVPAGPCQGDSEVLVVALGSAMGPVSFTAVDAAGQTVNSPFTQNLAGVDRIVGSGCASGLAAQPSRVIAYGGRSTQTGDDFPIGLLVADDGTRRAGQWINFAPVAGFTPQLGNDPASLLGVVIDIQGATLSRYRLAPLASTQLELEEVASDDIFTFASAMQGGDIDDDDLVDLAVIMDFGSDDQERNRSRLQIVLGASYQGQRIVGVSEERRLRDPHLAVADFDGDGADDILLADRTNFTILRGTRPELP